MPPLWSPSDRRGRGNGGRSPPRPSRWERAVDVLSAISAERTDREKEREGRDRGRCERSPLPSRRGLAPVPLGAGPNFSLRDSNFAGYEGAGIRPREGIYPNYLSPST